MIVLYSVEPTRGTLHSITVVLMLMLVYMEFWNLSV